MNIHKSGNWKENMIKKREKIIKFFTLAFFVQAALISFSSFFISSLT